MTTDTVAPLQPLIEWVIDLLTTAIGRPFGDGTAPPSTMTEEDIFPYGIVHHIDSTRWGPPMITADRNVDLTIQIDCTGIRQDQSRTMLDRARSALLDVDGGGRYLRDPAGVVDRWAIKQRSFDSGPIPIVGEGERPDRVFTVAERYTIRAVRRT